MAEFTNYLILTFTLAFVIYMGYSSTPSYQEKYGFTSSIGDAAQTQVYKINNATNAMLNSQITVNTGPFFGSISFPNPFAIFYNIFALLITIIKAPFDIIGALDLAPIIKQFLQGVYLLIGVYLGFTWFKGQTK